MNIAVNVKKTNFKKILVLIAILLLLATLILGFVINNMLQPLDKDNTEEYKITIRPGSSTYTIAQILTKESIIKDPNVFRLYARIYGLDGKFRAGEYILSPSMDIETVANKLLSGQVVTYSFTIPEGFTLKQIAQVLVDKEYIDAEKFWKVVIEEPFPEFDFLADLPMDDKRLEGYLFPDTYHITKGMSEKQIIEMMLRRFVQVYNQLPENTTHLSQREIVILASIVELEARVDKDRPLIASVFLNRLRINMPLQADATLQYVFPERKTRVLYRDLEIDSPYNTYKYRGLTPGPIGSPGRASLEAVHQPANSDYFYFVARKDGSGEHVFGRTLQEHNSNRRKLGY